MKRKHVFRQEQNSTVISKTSVQSNCFIVSKVRFHVDVSWSVARRHSLWAVLPVLSWLYIVKCTYIQVYLNRKRKSMKCNIQSVSKLFVRVGESLTIAGQKLITDHKSTYQRWSETNLLTRSRIACFITRNHQRNQSRIPISWSLGFWNPRFLEQIFFSLWYFSVILPYVSPESWVFGVLRSCTWHVRPGEAILQTWSWFTDQGESGMFRLFSFIEGLLEEFSSRQFCFKLLKPNRYIRMTRVFFVKT